MNKNKDQSMVEDESGPCADEDDGDDGYGKSSNSHMSKKKEGGLQDPLVVCGCDIMLMILSRLDARSLASTLLVSRRWRMVASSDTLWSRKVRD